MAALLMFLGFARQSSDRERERNAHPVFEASTDADMRDVERCLTEQLGLDPRGWEGLNTRVDWHLIWKTKVQISQVAATTHVTMWTPEGRLLREREKSALKSCVLVSPRSAVAAGSI
ncbi:hypothetical protein [Novosphingobium sp. PhB165]|uniref:hypothetical protein n=1 Tax=Novosphingobium sp. PhB165 TaxID=2485105 RepID=UPI00104DB982|nr:hypothetical protein [Novosphingobium sp. PhB165]